MIARPESAAGTAGCSSTAGPGDREKARELLNEAIAMYREIGMPKHLEIAQALLERC